MGGGGGEKAGADILVTLNLGVYLKTRSFGGPGSLQYPWNCRDLNTKPVLKIRVFSGLFLTKHHVF